MIQCLPRNFFLSRNCVFFPPTVFTYYFPSRLVFFLLDPAAFQVSFKVPLAPLAFKASRGSFEPFLLCGSARQFSFPLHPLNHHAFSFFVFPLAFPHLFYGFFIKFPVILLPQSICFSDTTPRTIGMCVSTFALCCLSGSCSLRSFFFRLSEVFCLV